MYFAYGETETEYLKRKDKALGAVIDAVGHVWREVDGDLFAAVSGDRNQQKSEGPRGDLRFFGFGPYRWKYRLAL